LRRAIRHGQGAHQFLRGIETAFLDQQIMAARRRLHFTRKTIGYRFTDLTGQEQPKAVMSRVLPVTDALLDLAASKGPRWGIGNGEDNIGEETKKEKKMECTIGKPMSLCSCHMLLVPKVPLSHTRTAVPCAYLCNINTIIEENSIKGNLLSSCSACRFGQNRRPQLRE
jgi:hypothetical protein